MADSVVTTRLAVAIGVVAALLVGSGVWIWNLDQRLATAEQTREELRAGLTGAVGDVADLAGKQQNLETTIAALPRSDDVQAEVAVIRSQVAAIEDRLEASASGDPSGFSSRLDSVEAQLAQLDMPDLGPLRDGLASVQRDMQQVQTQLDGAAPERVEQLTGRVEALTGQLASLEIPDISSVADELEQLDGRLDAVETDVARAVSAGPESLQGRVDALAGQLAAISVPDLAPIEERLTALATDVDDLKPAVAAAASRDQVGDETAGLSTQIGELDQRVASVRAETEELTTQVGELSAALASKAESAETASLTEQLDALRRQVAALPVADAAELEDEVAALREAVSQVPRHSTPAELVERIQFGVNEASVAPAEQAKIDAVARVLRESPATLQLLGFSDSQGPAGLNRTLSLRRAAAVRAALIAAGVDPAAVTSVVGLGEDGPPVDLGDDVEEARNRVVMIYRRP